MIPHLLKAQSTSQQQSSEPVNILYKEMSQSVVNIDHDGLSGVDFELIRLKEENNRMKRLMEIKDRAILGLEEMNRQLMYGNSFEDCVQVVNDVKAKHQAVS